LIVVAAAIAGRGRHDNHGNYCGRPDERQAGMGLLGCMDAGRVSRLEERLRGLRQNCPGQREKQAGSRDGNE
jgi:hypothetical protein